MDVLNIAKLVSILAVTALNADCVAMTVPAPTSETFFLAKNPTIYPQGDTYPGGSFTYTLSDNVAEDGDTYSPDLPWAGELATLYPAPITSLCSDFVPSKVIPMGYYGQAGVRGTLNSKYQGFERADGGKSVMRWRIQSLYKDKDVYLKLNGS